jgi:RNA polymerase sigma-70 factor (ECF subfamily)
MTLTTSPDLAALLQKNDATAGKQLFEAFYGMLAGIAQRYAKSQPQAEEMLHLGFHNCLDLIRRERQPVADLEKFMEKAFSAECVAFIKSIRSEYYVASTVFASDAATQNYDLFANNEIIDFKRVDNDILIKALQQLVPSQRLVFNLHVIEGYSLEEASVLLESSSQTVKSNLEKARFNLQKNIEKSLKNVKI